MTDDLSRPDPERTTPCRHAHVEADRGYVRPNIDYHLPAVAGPVCGSAVTHHDAYGQPIPARNGRGPAAGTGSLPR